MIKITTAFFSVLFATASSTAAVSAAFLAHPPFATPTVCRRRPPSPSNIASVTGGSRRKLLLLLEKEGDDNGSNQGKENVVRIPVGRSKERYVRLDTKTVIAKLEQEYRDLMERLRHDLFRLKQKQCEVAREEDELLNQAMDEIEVGRIATELEVVTAEEGFREAHSAVEQARKYKSLAVQKLAQKRKAYMESELNDYRAAFGLRRASADLKKSQQVLAASEKVERQALLREARVEALLKFLEEQEAALKEISTDPEKEQLWAQEQLLSTTHQHKSLLQVAELEWETEKLWHQLRDDLLELKRRQLKVDKEEQLLVAEAAEIIAFQAKEQKEKIQMAKVEMKKAHEEVEHAVARKEEAYEDTLLAIKKGDIDPRCLWMLSEAAMDLKESGVAADAVKEKLTQIAATEAHATDLLILLEQTASILEELRLPGHEKALQKWVEDELSAHESMLEVVKDKLVRS